MAPAYELFYVDEKGNEEYLATLVCAHLDVSDDDSRAQAEGFLLRTRGEEGVGRWLQGGAKVRESRG
jgi:hypothetical protein